ncbi:MAG: hypothetical protein AAF235_06230, partial [Planctomycetota bacterium]
MRSKPSQQRRSLARPAHEQTPPKRTRVSLAVSLAAVFLLGGCISGPQGKLARQKFDPLPIAFADSVTWDELAIDVENVHGSVRIEADAWRTEPEITANIRWESETYPETWGAGARPLQFIARAAQEFGLPPVLTVTTRRTRPDVAFTEADIVIRCPPVAGVRVRTGGGDVVLNGISGAVTVEIGTGGLAGASPSAIARSAAGGDVVVRTDSSLGDPVAIQTVDGSVTVIGPTDLGGRLDLYTAQGRALVIAPNADVREATGVGGSTWTGQLAGNNEPFSVRSGGGDIRVYAVSRPMLYTPPVIHLPESVQQSFPLSTQER